MAKRMNVPLGQIPKSSDSALARQGWAKRIQDPAVLNAMTAVTYVMPNPDQTDPSGETGTIQWLAAIDHIEDRAKAVRSGDVSGIEATLVAQAVALNAIFTKMAWKALDEQQARNLRNMDSYLQLALKAQRQVCLTAETLAKLRNPPLMLVQTNISQGHQQINNNGDAPQQTMHPENSEPHESEMSVNSNWRPRADGSDGRPRVKARRGLQIETSNSSQLSK